MKRSTYKCDMCRSDKGECVVTDERTDEKMQTLPSGCPWGGKAEWKEVKGVPDMPSKPPPPKKKEATDSKIEKEWRCNGCRRDCVLLNPLGSELPVVCPYGTGVCEWEGVYSLKIKGEGATGNHWTAGGFVVGDETTALVTADECLRVIAAYQKECDAVNTFVSKPEPLKDALHEAAQAAAKALQILMMIPAVTVKDADDE